MISLIPRLVLDENEVSKIIHDALNDESEDRKSNRSLTEDTENEKDHEMIGPESSPSILRSVSLPSFLAGCKKFADKLHQIIVGFPLHICTTTTTITQGLLDFPAYVRRFTGNLPHILKKLYTIIITWILNGISMIATSFSEAVNIIKDLPHRATFQWRHLLGVLAVMILCPLLGEIVFLLPMNPVDNGPKDNQVFIYGIMTLYQFFIQLPWVETCNFAMPQVKIPIRARLVALLVGLIIAKFIDVILTSGIFTYEPVFPIPFSILVTGTVGTLPAVPIIYFMTKKTDRELGNFSLMFTLLVTYWVALLVVIGWAIGIQRLQGNSLQYLILFSYAVLRFTSKVILCANISTRLQPKRHVQLNLVVDILFTRVQVATWPFISSPFTLMVLFASECSVILWRYYDGVDRVQLWWGAMLATASLDHNQDDVSKGKKLKGITEACLTASNQYIINMSLSEDKKDVVRSLTACKTSSTLSESSCTTSDTIEDFMEKNNNRFDILHEEGAVWEMLYNYTSKLPDQFVFLESLSTANNTVVLFNDEDHIVDPVHNSAYRRDADKESSFYDEDEEDDSSAESKMGECGLAGILRRPNGENASSDVDAEDGSKIVDIELRDHPPRSSPPHSKETWEQRDLYHMVDSTGSLCVNIIVRINQQLIFVVVRNLPSAEHLNESFQISEERWQEAQVFGGVYIALMMLLLIGINFSSVFFSNKQGLEGKKLSLGRVLSYLFKENFLHFFIWLISTGALVSSAMVNHFGADFSMDFKYLKCLDNIEWPGCPSE